MPPISFRLDTGQFLKVSLFQGKLMRTIALFLIAVLSTTASHATYTWTTLNHPSAISTSLTGIDGTNMVGYYGDSSYNSHSFMVTATSPVPEPRAILLALFGLALLPRRRRQSASETKCPENCPENSPPAAIQGPSPVSQ